MKAAPAGAPGYWQVVRLLLAISYRRAIGRRRRQRDLFRQRAKKTTDFSQLAFVGLAAILALLHVATAFTIVAAVAAGEQAAAEQRGYVVVDKWFIVSVSHGLRDGALDPPRSMSRAYRVEAAQLARRQGGDPKAIEESLRQAVSDGGTTRLMSRRAAAPGLSGLPRAGHLPGLLGTVTLVAWFVMMAFQGEGLELDIQRRRHPMWEWLFSHPVPQGAVFLAEMLSPMVANPIYFSAPLLPGCLYGFIYGPAAGVLAAVLVGIPVTVAASCLGKAMEVAVTLRFAMRSRGAIIGVMGWLGYVTMVGLGLAALSRTQVFLALAGPLSPMAVVPWPYLGWFLGLLPDGRFFLPLGVTVDMVCSALLIAASIRFSVWGAARGLAGDPGAGAASGAGALRQSAHFGADALYRKEILWFLRDRSALVQAILIPVTLGGFQAFNLRGALAHAGHEWSGLCGVGVVFGTYFLMILGPKSLASEGNALWIPLTWPHGLEKLLLAKAWMWTLLATGIVGLVLIYAAIRFPGGAWQVALLGVAWFLFARSMAAKAVTLATVTSEAGEIQRAPAGRRWAAQLGMLTFSIGVLSQQWNLVVMGVVYSTVTAAAMWQNFRARLPFLYDPWSETLPEAPTLMHAMIGISALVEIGAVITGAMLIFVPRSQVAIAHAVIYGFCAAAVSLGTAYFLRRRSVAQGAIWNWRETGQRRGQVGMIASLLLGLALGAVLGGVAIGYLALIGHLPFAADQLRQGSAVLQSVPYMRQSLVVMAVLIAPLAEEFLFRGLLYRALDREWGGWRAVLGSAAFFAVYHPMLSWAPVFLLGATNAVLFKRTGRLAAAVVLHMTYNMIVAA